MFNINVSLLIRTFAPANYCAKIINYDENSANKYVNNCYRSGIFPRKSAFSQEWHLFVATYSR